MIVITIKKSLLKFIILSFVIILGIGFYLFFSGSENFYDRASITYITTFLASSNTYENIEIFDIGKERVVKIVKVNDIALDEAKKCLNGITGILVKVMAFPDKGYIIKVPFEPIVKVNNQWLNEYNLNYIDKFFIIFPDEGNPYLLVLDDRERPFFFTFDSNTKKLMKSLNFEIDNTK